MAWVKIAPVAEAEPLLSREARHLSLAVLNALLSAILGALLFYVGRNSYQGLAWLRVGLLLYTTVAAVLLDALPKLLFTSHAAGDEAHNQYPSLCFTMRRTGYKTSLWRRPLYRGRRRRLRRR